MKALVSGGAGFLGSAIVRELIKDGTQVKVLVREGSDTRNIDGLEVEKAYGDVRDKDSVKSALQGCDAFYHTAALYSLWTRDSKVFYDINVEGTRAALNGALEQGVDKVVYTSTVAAVGFYGPDSPANEESEYNLWKAGHHYSRSKHLAELEVRKLADKGLPVVIVNPAMVIGVRDSKPTPSGQTIVDIVNKQMPGYLEGGTNIIDVEDVARGHVLAAHKGRSGERYILGNENVTQKDYFALVAEVAGVDAPQKKLPYSLALMLGYGYQLVSSITGRPAPLTAADVRILSRHACFDCSKAVRELGLPQTPIKTTIGKAIKWFEANGYVKTTAKT